MHKRITVRNFTFALLALVSAGAVATAQKTPVSYWPFKTGSTWTMATEIGDKKMDQVITVKNVSTPKSGATDAELDYSINGQSVQTEIYRTDAKGVSRVASGLNGANTIEPPFPIIRYPMTAGQSWDWKGKITANGKSNNGSAKLTVSGPENIVLKTGTVKAMRVHSALVITSPDGAQKLELPNDYWFSSNLGMVQQKAQLGKIAVSGKVSSYKLQ